MRESGFADSRRREAEHVMSGTKTSNRDSRIVVEEVPVKLFGHASTPARLELHARDRAWRIRKSLLPLGLSLVVAPLVALLPPHAPWVVLALGIGGYLASRRWRERYTIRELDGECPRCGAGLDASRGVRLRSPHPLACGSCGHEPLLAVDDGRLNAARRREEDAAAESAP